MPTVPVRRSSLVALFLRLCWMAIGPIALFALGGLIAQRSGFSAVDIGFGAALASVLLARFVDITQFEGTTADGEPTTPAYFWWYALRLVLGGGAAWMVAHWLQSHF